MANKGQFTGKNGHFDQTHARVIFKTVLASAAFIATAA